MLNRYIIIGGRYIIIIYVKDKITQKQTFITGKLDNEKKEQIRK